MSDLIESIKQAYQEPEQAAHSAKVHRLFLNNLFILPVKKKSNKEDEPEALFITEGDNHFLPIFSEDIFFDDWAKELASEMDKLKITGKDIVIGAGETSHLCLDISQPHYKEFDPSEIVRLKQVVSKLERIAKGTAAK